MDTRAGNRWDSMGARKGAKQEAWKCWAASGDVGTLGGSWGCPQQQEDTHGSWWWWCPAHRYPPLRAQPLRQAAGWMPGEADHRAVAVAAANEALRLIKKTSKTQKHNEEPVYQSIRGHEYANKSLNCLPAASSPALAQIGAARGGFPGGPRMVLCPSVRAGGPRGGEGLGRGAQPSLQRSLELSGQGMGGISQRGPAPAAPEPS